VVRRLNAVVTVAAQCGHAIIFLLSTLREGYPNGSLLCSPCTET